MKAALFRINCSLYPGGHANLAIDVGCVIAVRVVSEIYRCRHTCPREDNYRHDLRLHDEVWRKARPDLFDGNDAVLRADDDGRAGDLRCLGGVDGEGVQLRRGLARQQGGRLLIGEELVPAGMERLREGEPRPVRGRS